MTVALRVVSFDSRRRDALYLISPSAEADLDRLQQAGKPTGIVLMGSKSKFKLQHNAG